MAQNCTGFGQKAPRAAGGGLAGAAEPAAPHHCPVAAADLHPQRHMWQCQTDRPARINQFKLGI